MTPPPPSPSSLGTGKDTVTNEGQSDSQPPRDSELIVVGDRIFADVVLANRMRHRRSVFSTSKPGPDQGPGTLAIWTTHVWEKEVMLMRWAERRVLKAIEAWLKPRSPPSESGSGNEQEVQAGRFVKPVALDRPVKGGVTGDGGMVEATPEGAGGWVWEWMKRRRS
jgi:hypothetical protein